jgi:hypothetical protein
MAIPCFQKRSQLRTRGSKDDDGLDDQHVLSQLDKEGRPQQLVRSTTESEKFLLLLKN